MPRPQHESTTPLAKALRTLRNDAKLTSVEAARRAGVSQTTISRYEVGRTVPSPAAVQDLCRIYGAPPETRRELVSLAEATHGGNVAADLVRKRGGWQMQERVMRAEQAATTITGWHPNVIDGTCQTRAYASALFRGEDENTKRTVDARMERQELLRSGRHWRIAYTEGGLLWCMGSPAVMVEQLDTLIELSGLPNVELGVVPRGTPARVSAKHAFTIYDQAAVHFGTIHETLFVSNHAYVQQYLEVWERLLPLIAWGDDARAVFARVRDFYSTL